MTITIHIIISIIIKIIHITILATIDVSTDRINSIDNMGIRINVISINIVLRKMNCS